MLSRLRELAARHKKLTAALIVVLVLVLAVLLLHPKGTKTYLILGMDNYGSLESAEGRSDVTMLVQIDFTTAHITTVSFARDMFIRNADGGDAKLNTIVRYSSEEEMVRAIEDNFGVEIDGWFRVNFASVILLVDALGGAQVELTSKEAAYIDRQIGKYDDHPLAEGLCLLNGEQALTFARCRKLDNDIGRGARQSRLMAAMVAQTKRLTIPRLIGVFNSLSDMWRSSLSAGEQASLFASALWLRGARVTAVSMPMEGYWHYGQSRDGVSGIVIDEENNRRLLLEALGYPPQK